MHINKLRSMLLSAAILASVAHWSTVTFGPNKTPIYRLTSPAQSDVGNVFFVPDRNKWAAFFDDGLIGMFPTADKAKTAIQACVDQKAGGRN